MVKQEVTVLTENTFHDFIIDELRTRGQEIAIPKPSREIVEVHNILAGEGYNVAPVVYVDRKKGEATYGVSETVVRPDYTDGTQMYYSNPDEDPLAQIIERGRTGRQQRIAVPAWVRHVPTKSRFAVSWYGIHNFIAPEVVNTIPYLKEQLTKSGIVFRVPTEAEFQSSGERYPHFRGAKSWEWLYDSDMFDIRLVGGRPPRAAVGPWAVPRWPASWQDDYIGFCLRAVSPSQKLP